MPAWALIRHWKLALAAVLLLAVGVQTIRVERLQTIVAKLTGQNKALRLDLDRVREMTELADKKAREAKAAAEAEYKRKAEMTDAKHKADLADARRRAANYADRNRVPAPASGRPASRAAPSADSDAPEGANRPRDDSGVVVTRADFDTLVDNTLRLKAARDWACSLEGARCE